MQIGLFPNSDPTNDDERLSLFASLLQGGGTVFQISPNVQKERWEKVVWNAAWNPLTTLTAVPVQTWLDSSDESLNITKQLMREVIDVGRKCGVPLEYELADQLIEKVLAMPSPIFSSMYVDSKEEGAGGGCHFGISDEESEGVWDGGTCFEDDLWVDYGC